MNYGSHINIFLLYVYTVLHQNALSIHHWVVDSRKVGTVDVKLIWMKRGVRAFLQQCPDAAGWKNIVSPEKDLIAWCCVTYFACDWQNCVVFPLQSTGINCRRRIWTPNGQQNKCWSVRACYIGLYQGLYKQIFLFFQRHEYITYASERCTVSFLDHFHKPFLSLYLILSSCVPFNLKFWECSVVLILILMKNRPL